ncbi:MAG TPA: response regulator [Candidatus Nanopelagicaceae bacterium]
MIRTLIVEDDFRVADIHAAYVSRVAGFEVIGKAHTGASAYDLIVAEKPDLVLLDLYLPDENGLELFARLQQLPREAKTDVFIITAARDSQHVREALQLGAANYIVKPFTHRQLAERLLAYRAARERFKDGREVSQADVDRVAALLRGARVTTSSSQDAKNPTADSIMKFMRVQNALVSANDISEALGLSRATAQRYLANLVESETLELELQYGTTGRPIHRYRIRTL